LMPTTGLALKSDRFNRAEQGWGRSPAAFFVPIPFPTTSILPFYSLYTLAVNIYFELLIYYMEAKTKTIEQFKTHSKDTGSADVQIALLTERINHLTGHLQGNAKDHSSRRGLLMMVSQRRRLLDYLHNTDLGRYQAVTKKLKLRK
jgi:small subunit ribosomal protein S15